MKIENLVNQIMGGQSQLPKNDTTATSTALGLDLTQIIDLLPCYISILDRDFRILFANQHFQSDFGDALGKLCHTIYKGSQTVCPGCPVQNTFRDKCAHVKEKTVQLANGRICQILIQTSPILSNDGEVAAVIEMSTNITEIKKSQK